MLWAIQIINGKFQSTCPSRGETSLYNHHIPAHIYFNPLAPRGARRVEPIFSIIPRIFQSTRPSRGETLLSSVVRFDIAISIHSPLAGRDYLHLLLLCYLYLFQSTRPSRGETCREHFHYLCGGISIHSPLAGRDAREMVKVQMAAYISIHSPLAGRDNFSGSSLLDSGISIHSPLAGRDQNLTVVPSPGDPEFQSTRPSRGETQFLHSSTCSHIFQSTRPSRGETGAVPGADRLSRAISIHSPLAGRDPGEAAAGDAAAISIHSPLAGRDRRPGTRGLVEYPYFNPLAPRGARRCLQ